MRELSSAAQKRGFACGIIRIKGGREKDQGDLGITVHEIAFVLPKAISVRKGKPDVRLRLGGNFREGVKITLT